MGRKPKAPVKAEPKKPKGPDNNKRLAELETAEAARQAAVPELSDLQRTHPLEYEQGRRAAEASIAKNQPPFGAGKALDAWLEGYDSFG